MNSITICDDEEIILNSLKLAIKKNVGSEPNTTLNPQSIRDLLKQGKTLPLMAFDFDLQYVSNKTGLEHLIALDEEFSDQIKRKVLFSKGIIDHEDKLFCKKVGITVFEKNLKDLPGQLCRLLHENTVKEQAKLTDTVSEIIGHRRTSEEIWLDMKLRFKNELLESLKAIENKESKFNLNMSDSISIEQLIEEIENETPLGLQKIESWAKAQFRINKSKK